MARKKKLMGNMGSKNRESRLGKVFRGAQHFAMHLHADQRRKVSGEPYAEHLKRVATCVNRHGGDKDEVAAAWLHDAVEDQGIPLEEIRQLCGERVARIADGCTLPKSPGTTWGQRRSTYLNGLPDASTSVHLVKAADALDNAQSLLREHRALGDRLWGHFNGSLPEIQWYYRQLADLLRSRVPPLLAKELERAVSKIERIAPGNGCQRGGFQSGKG